MKTKNKSLPLAIRIFGANTLQIQATKKQDCHLEDSQTQLWLVHVKDYLANVADFFNLLDSQEKEQAVKFKFENDRNCFVVSHAILRILLGRYLNCLPEIIRYQYNSHGKPALIGEHAFLEFNLSHSHGLVLIGVTKNQPIGVDIEYMKRDVAKDELVERFFSEKEHEEYKKLSVKQKTLGFYNAWTRKEAFLKAIGEGISYSLKKFSVNLTPGEDAKLIEVEGSVKKAAKWRLVGFMPEEDYCAAVCIFAKKTEIDIFYCFVSL